MIGTEGYMRRIEYTFDDLSRVRTTAQWNAATSGTKRNEVRCNYDGWGQSNSECVQM
jgi:hypothetical protein